MKDVPIIAIVDGESWMMRPRQILIVGLSIFAAACATESFGRDQVRATDAKLTREVESQDSRLRETADRAAAILAPAGPALVDDGVVAGLALGGDEADVGGDVGKA